MCVRGRGVVGITRSQKVTNLMTFTEYARTRLNVMHNAGTKAHRHTEAQKHTGTHTSKRTSVILPPT